MRSETSDRVWGRAPIEFETQSAWVRGHEMSGLSPFELAGRKIILEGLGLLVDCRRPSPTPRQASTIYLSFKLK